MAGLRRRTGGSDMQLSVLHRRSLAFYWRTNLGVILGAAVGTAVLTGALIVGDSMRGSLREAALGRLGRVDQAIVSSRFFREALAAEISTSPKSTLLKPETCPAILLSGGTVHASSQARSNRVNILGVDERFWRLGDESGMPSSASREGRSVVLNAPLAEELGASIGDDILLRLGKPSPISTETLLGRRDDTTATLRLTVRAIVPATGVGAFSLNPRQLLPRNAYVPLATLQRALDKADRVNTILLSCPRGRAYQPDAFDKTLREIVTEHVSLADYGFVLRPNVHHGYLGLESDTMLIPQSVEAVAEPDRGHSRFGTSGVLTYLANTIAKTPGTTVIPYSTVAAIDPEGLVARALELAGGERASTLAPGEVLLNDWAAEELSAKPGDRIKLTYYVTGDFGRLETRSEEFTLRDIVPLAGAANDTGFTPEYEGVTDAQSLTEWDPPFPMDLSLIRDQDEAYWDNYRATPKAFITLEDGVRLWGHDADRFGRLTSIRIYPTVPTANMSDIVRRYDRFLARRIDAGQFGLAFKPVRRQVQEASKGSTDFGGLFLGFSFFLIASAAMLVALLFRLNVEQRSAELGLKLAVGFSPRAVGRHAIVEGAGLAAIGCAAGTAAGMGYAWLMLTGLRTWWVEAVNTPFLTLHVSDSAIIIGFLAGFFLALISIAWSMRELLRCSPHSLLAGTVASASPETKRRTAGLAKGVSFAAFLVALVVAAAPYLTEAIPRSLAFFISGAAMLTAGLSLFASRLRGDSPGVIDRPGSAALWRLGLRNARRQAGRSILTASLIASATFLITALQAFHLSAGTEAHAKESGTGGFSLYAESTTPLVYDLNTPDGREALGVVLESNDIMRDASVAAFRLRPGDESSCLNLYKPTAPRFLGAGRAVIDRGGFTFSKSLAESPSEIANPWTLLNRTFDDDAIPVIGDESAVLWQLHLGLGKDLVVSDESGVDVRLRFVALLSGSALQDELIVGDEHFTTMFPSSGGHSFFLIETPQDSVGEIEDMLERELSSFGFDVGLTSARLGDYLAVQNTYLSTFQALGGFGLLLGSIGLAAVLLRNVWERRRELALMRAVGYSRSAVGYTILAENTALLLIGLVIGVLAALVAIAPHIVDRPSTLPWQSVGLILAAVFATGLVSGGLATLTALRAPLIPALRAE